jgi:hypothetical protein
MGSSLAALRFSSFQFHGVMYNVEETKDGENAS